MATTPIRYHPNYLRIAFQGAFMTALCIGLPAGLVFWGFLLETSLPPPFANFVELLLIDNPVVVPCVVLLGAAGWGWALSRITNYSHAVRLALATGVAVFLVRDIWKCSCKGIRERNIFIFNLQST